MCIDKIEFHCNDFSKDYFYQECSGGDRAFITVIVILWALLSALHKVWFRGGGMYLWWCLHC